MQRFAEAGLRIRLLSGGRGITPGRMPQRHELRTGKALQQVYEVPLRGVLRQVRSSGIRAARPAPRRGASFKGVVAIAWLRG